MRIPVFTILGVVLLSLQTSFLPIIPEWLGLPELLFLLIVFASVYLSIAEGVVLCLVFGMAMEVVSGSFLGIYVVSYGAIFFMIRGFSAWIAMEHSSSLPGIAALAYLLSRGLVYVFTAMLTDESLAPWVWGDVLLRVLIVAVLILPFDALFQLILEKCDAKRQRRSFFRRRSFKSGNRYRPRQKG